MSSMMALAPATGVRTSESAARITVRWEYGFAAAPNVPALFEHLGARCPAAGVFASAPWCAAAESHLLAGRRCLTLVGMAGARPAFVLPLSWGWERRHRLPLRTLRWLGDPLADRVPLMVDREVPGAIAGLVEALASPPLPVDVTILSEVPRAQDDIDALAELLAAKRLSLLRRWSSHAPLLRLSGSGTPVTRSKSLKTRLGRARKKLAAAGGHRVERHVPRPDEVADLLRKVKAVEDASWKGQRQVGIFSGPVRLAFFEALSREFASRGWLVIYLMLLGEELISYRYGFCRDGVFYDYNLAFTPPHASLSPGRVLLDDIIEDCRHRGLRAVDASRGSLVEPHLLADWTDDAIEHDDLWIFRPTPLGLAARALECSIKPRVRRLRARVMRIRAGGRAPRPAEVSDDGR